MYSVTKWYSFDEEEFDSKEECEAYESDIQDMLKSVVFLNEAREIMYDPKLDEIESDAYYMYIIDAEKAQKLFDWMRSFISFDQPREDFSDGDRLAYNSDSGDWDNIDVEAYMINKRIKELDEALSEYISKDHETMA